MRIPRCQPGLFFLVGLLLMARAPWPHVARAEVASEARTAGEIFERKPSLLAALLHVAGDLQVRAQADGVEDPATLILVPHATAGLLDELEVMAAALPRMARDVEGGLQVGIRAPDGEAIAPMADLRSVQKALVDLARRPVRPLLAPHRAIRAAARAFPPGRGPRAVLLLADAGAELEDDVEATRDSLLTAGAAFYAIGPEAAFERPWHLPPTTRVDPDHGLEERRKPSPERRRSGTVFYGGEVAYPLVPWAWELNLAQTDFYWGKPPRYPVPSGFGFWSLATLAYATGGRYFLHDFQQPAAARARGTPGRRTLLYEISRLNHLAPDLRPRARVRKDLSKDARARTILRIWEHLAEEASPIIGVRGYLELTSGALAERATRPIRSRHQMPVWYEEMDDVRKAIQAVDRRLDRLELARRWWGKANARPREEGAAPRCLDERIEADFQLLGLFLAQVRLQRLEQRAALETIKPLHVSYRRVRLVPRLLVLERDGERQVIDLQERERNLTLVELRLARNRVGRRYRQTPWALLVERQKVYTYDIDVQVIDEDEEQAERRRRREAQRRARAGGKAGGGDAARPAPQPKPPARPGPRPGSHGGGGVTEGD